MLNDLAEQAEGALDQNAAAGYAVAPEKMCKTAESTTDTISFNTVLKA